MKVSDKDPKDRLPDLNWHARFEKETTRAKAIKLLPQKQLRGQAVRVRYDRWRRIVDIEKIDSW